MADTDLPGLGKVNKKWFLVVGGISASILGYAYYKKRKAGGAITATPVTSTGTDTTTTDGSTDPSQYTAGSYDAGGYGSVPTFYDPSTGQYITTGTSTTTTVTTNAAWAQQVEQYLVTLNYDSNTAAAAIGKVLSGQSVTQAQADIWAAATGFEGEPPQGHPPIHIVGDQGGGSTPLKAPGNIHTTAVGKTTATIAWSGVTGAQGYLVSGAGHTYDATGTSYSLSNLHSNTHYTVNVQALAGGQGGPLGHAVSFKTNK